MDKSAYSILDIVKVWDIAKEQYDGKITLIGNEIEEGSGDHSKSEENVNTESNNDNNN